MQSDFRPHTDFAGRYRVEAELGRDGATLEKRDDGRAMRSMRWLVTAPRTPWLAWGT